MQLEKLSGLELGELVNQKEVSPVEVIKYFEKRISERDPSLNAFTYTMIDDALNEAKMQEERIMNGENLGPFAGVPVGLKDFLDSKMGWKNSHGGVEALIREDIADSMFYKAAYELGAIAIGKTNSPAFGFSGACENKLYGATHNPFDISRTSGGSSGGTGAAVADGLIILGEGGDAGGSIRIPSAWCNLFGFKPSLGTVPSYCRPDGWTATHPYCFNGCLTKTVADSVTMLQSMAQYNPRDPISLPINSTKNFLELMNKPIKGMKIGVTYDFSLYSQIDKDIIDRLDNAMMLLELADVSIELISQFNFTHSLEEILYCWAWSISIDTALDLAQWRFEGLDLVKDYRDQLPEEFIMFNEVASKANIWDMRKFNEIRTDILDNFEDAFTKYDLIISPTTICKPMKNETHGRCIEVNGVELDPSLNFISFGETPLANFVGYPSASIPIGVTPDNLPVGMQIIGKQYHDEDVLAAAKTFEAINPWYHNYEIALNRM